MTLAVPILLLAIVITALARLPGAWALLSLIPLAVAIMASVAILTKNASQGGVGEAKALEYLLPFWALLVVGVVSLAWPL